MYYQKQRQKHSKITRALDEQSLISMIVVHSSKTLQASLDLWFYVAVA
jgi:hypothetical protein